MSTAAFLILVFAAFAAPRAAAAASASLNLLWAIPVEVQAQTLSSSAIVLRDGPRAQNEPVVFLGTEKRSQVFLKPSSAGPGVKPLTVKATVLRLMKHGDTIWLGGLSNKRAYVPGGDIADRYVGKLDAQGQVVAEYSFRSGKWGLINDLAPLPSGNVVVAGQDGSAAWVAEISKEGNILWERRFGIGKGISIATLGNQIFAVAFDAIRSGGNSTYREDVRIWKINNSGELQGSQLVREGINFQSSAHYGRVAVVRSHDALYALSSFRNPSAARPLEISKIDADGHKIWSRTLSQTMWQQPNSTAGWRQSCQAGKAVLKNGDLLIACAVESQILLFQLDADTSEVTERSVSLPDCNRMRPTALFLYQKPDGIIWLLGSLPEGVGGTGCTWLGELVLKN